MRFIALTCLVTGVALGCDSGESPDDLDGDAATTPSAEEPDGGADEAERNRMVPYDWDNGGAGGTGGNQGGKAGEGPTPEEAAAGNYNNQGTIAGPTIGGTASYLQARRELAVTLLDDNGAFALGTAYGIRVGKAIKLVVPVTNKSGRFQCFLEADVMRLKSGTGATLGDEEGTFVAGSLGVASTGWTSTCLGPDEEGYFFTIKLDLNFREDYYTPARALEVHIETQDFNLPRPKAHVTPVSYEVGARDVLQREEVRITVKNEGDSTIKISKTGFTKILGMDAGGTPAGFDYVNEAVLNELVSAGGTTRITGMVSFEPAVAKVRVFIDATDPLATFATRPKIASDAAAIERQLARLQQSEAKARRLARMLDGQL